MPFCRLDKNHRVLLAIKVVVNAPRTEFDSLYGEDAVKLRVHAPPVDGAANAEIVQYLCTFFDLKRSDIALVSGEKSRDKVFSIRGVTLEELCSQILHHFKKP